MISNFETLLGKSTVVFDHALEKNKLNYSDFVNKNLRRANPFECHSVDNNKQWIEETKSANPTIKNVTFHYCPCQVTTFNERICTLYDNFPNISADKLIKSKDLKYSFTSNSDTYQKNKNNECIIFNTNIILTSKSLSSLFKVLY